MKCKICNSKAEYSDQWDAHFCRICNEWKEAKCGYSYPDCYFECHKRPDKPLEDK